MATLALLADAASSVNTFIDVFIYVYVLLIFVYILTSWVRLPYTPWVRRLSDFLRDVCEPYLRLFRRILPPLGPLDLSPVVAIVRPVLAEGRDRQIVRPVLLRGERR
jgi:uncharacterized protein YggT (Ycf19 family)